MKRRVWVRIGIGVAVAGAIVLGVVIDLQRKASAILKRHEAFATAKVEEIGGRSWPRVVLGDVLPGNRWDDLTKALDAFDAIPQSDTDELPAFQDPDPERKPNPEKIDAVLAAHRSCVDLLRAACRRDVLRPAYAYEQGLNMDLPYITKAMQACRYLRAVAERQHELGQDREAADHVLLALSVAQDMGAGGPIVNRMVEDIGEASGIRALRTILESHSMTTGELQAFGALLDRLWASRPRQLEAFEIEDGIARLGLIRAVNDSTVSQLLGGTFRSWRHFFSASLLMAEALNECELFFAEVIKIDRIRGPALRDAAAALEQKTKSSRNPIIAMYLPGISKVFRREMMAGMNWHLMRTAVALAAYEKDHGAFPATLEELVPKYLPRIENDPTSGRPFRFSGGKLWAFGGDGDDDGGRPMADEDREDDDGDVVWTVKRK
jgi:hypothetical protein